MDDRRCTQFFLEPDGTSHRQYEALRAYFIEAKPLTEVAERFGYTISTLKSLASRLGADLRRGNKSPLFSLTDEDDLQARVETATNRDPKPRRSPTIEN